VVSNVQTNSFKWESYGQASPNFKDCSPSPCEGVSWSTKYGITLPSLTNNATQFNLGGTTPFGDVLFTTELMGASAPVIKDTNHTLLPTLHNFTYDTDFYVTDVSITQALEFDVVMHVKGASMFWGVQCAPLGDKKWDTVDNTTLKWVSSGVPCKLANGWNHLTLKFTRGANNLVVYDSVTVNGTKTALNVSSPAGTVPQSWWGVNVNFQVDGNSKQSSNTIYLDGLNITYE
jgi:hypothetical protein